MNRHPYYSPHELNRQRYRLEQLVAKQPSLPWRQVLTQAGQRLVRFLTANPAEPRIWQSSQRGQVIWWIYDPVSQRRQSFQSELEVRQWLDSRYYS
ncbi:MAG: hypothetical protein EA342_11575 [Leptolyngbya sp. LCM1.Bin17]|nr:MAG: hypothetical protein EA342_11575 [Leptolyngbya sp. LCM1.Bin17]